MSDNRDKLIWFIWSNEHDGWWPSSERGYVKDIAFAGTFSQERATEICSSAGWLGRNRPAEVMVPITVAELTRRFPRAEG